MSLDVRGKVVVITGASRGLGRGMADAMRERGVRLGLCARGQVTERSHDVFARSVDVTDGEAVMAFAGEVVDALGPIDLWINNAGVLEPIAFVRDVSSEDFQQHLAINVLGVLHGAQAYLAQLSRRPPGHKGVILNISSGAALKGYAGWSAYCAGKAALDRLSECLQAEEGAGGLRVHSVAPGVIDTDMQ
ncbi:MAG: SDR family oxidoreductase, partial [Myxococcales bacterium]|nr:SDR family oxidoreductase [Myxococcales bacterium]